MNRNRDRTCKRRSSGVASADATVTPVEAAAIEPERLRLVAQARQIWRGRLIDLSRRNNLLYFRHLKAGTLDLSALDEERLAPLLRITDAPDDAAVVLTKLFGRDELTMVAARAVDIQRRATANLEERGLDTLHLVFGFATWRPDDDGRPPQAPVLLMPVRIEAAGRDGRLLTLRRTGDVTPNLVLLHALEHGFDVSVAAGELEALAEGDEDAERLDLAAVFDRLRQAARDVPEFRITSGVALGNFAFQKLAMVAELDQLGDGLASHDLIAAVAGFHPSRAQFQADRGDIPPDGLDRITADQEFLVLDADSSQQRAIRAVCAGKSGIISGPPGTGKSQTIVNLVAELAASGKRVLFVAEKRAALEVVLQRLSRLGLGHLCLDLHGADIKRRHVAERIGDALAAVRRTTKIDPAAQHREFELRRTRLNDHARLLHHKHPPSGMSAYGLQATLLAVPPDVHSSVRWRPASGLPQLDPQAVGRIEELLIDLAGVEDLFRGTSASPWRDAVVVQGSLTDASDRAAHLSGTDWPAFDAALAAVVRDLGPQSAATLERVGATVALLSDTDALLANYHARLFEADLDQLVSDLAPASSRLSHLWRLVTSSRYRAALKTMRALRSGTGASAATLLADARAAADVRGRWTSLGLHGIPRHCGGASELARVYAVIQDGISSLATTLQKGDALQLSLPDLADWLHRLAADTASPPRVVRVRQLEGDLLRLAGPAFVKELKTTACVSARWGDLFRYAWHRSCLDAIHQESPALASFDGRGHDRFVDDFRRLDRARIDLAVHRVRTQHAERVVDACNLHREQETLVRQESSKKRRHLPIRDLVGRASDVLTALFPCWLASPLSVSQLLPSRDLFDVVLFDEASQVLPEDAVPSFFRARQAVVAGDRRQLPPTTFFAAADDGAESEEEAVSGFESVLDNLSAFLAPEWHLDWHYRSRDEALIAFANHHIYRNRLVTFPGPGRDTTITHELVEQGGGEAEEESVAAEVRRVVDLVVRHAAERPAESLGVITMGVVHAQRIEAAIDRLRAERPDLAGFFDENRPERFFVKNLERVQGDERDAIGKDRAGRLPYRFGPLLQEGGERRLNVAITRARVRMTVVSSFSHLDMDPGRSSKEGVRLLRAYLEYAASGGRNLGRDRATDVATNAFEDAVASALAGRGIAVVPQFGASQFRIDLVAQHPERPGRLVLAIECDGASYHSAPTARDRDRLRQQHLEALGWRFHRIWSTDWFLKPAEELERAVRAYEDAVAFADRVDSGETEVVAPHDLPPVDTLPALPVAPAPAIERPNVLPGRAVDDYPERELVAVASWLLVHHPLATDQELLPLFMNELGFQRRGPKIVSRLERAMRQARAFRREAPG